MNASRSFVLHLRLPVVTMCAPRDVLLLGLLLLLCILPAYGCGSEQGASDAGDSHQRVLALDLIVREAGDLDSQYFFWHLVSLQRLAQRESTGEERPRDPALRERFDELVAKLAERRAVLADEAERLLEQGIPVLEKRLDKAGFSGATLEPVPVGQRPAEPDHAELAPQMARPLAKQPLARLRVHIPYGSGQRPAELVPQLRRLLTRRGRIQLRPQAPATLKDELRPYASQAAKLRDASNPDPLRLRWLPLEAPFTEHAWGADEQGTAWVLVDYAPTTEAQPVLDGAQLAALEKDADDQLRLVVAEGHAHRLEGWYETLTQEAPRVCLLLDNRIYWMGRAALDISARTLVLPAGEEVREKLAQAFREGKLPVNLELERVQTKRIESTGEQSNSQPAESYDE